MSAACYRCGKFLPSSFTLKIGGGPDEQADDAWHMTNPAPNAAAGLDQNVMVPVCNKCEPINFHIIPPLEKRPVAWRVGPFDGKWSVYQDEAQANRLAESYWDHAVSVQGLYVRDGT